MADIVNFNLRLDKQLRDEANAVLAGYGMTTAQAIRLFLTNIAHTKTIPLSFEYQRETGLSATAQAKLKQTIKEIENGDYTVCHSLDEMMASLENHHD